MFKNIEKEFKKASAYYTYRKVSFISEITGAIYLLIIFCLACFIDTVNEFGFISELTWKICVIVIGIALITFLIILEKFKPKEKEYYVWLRFFRFEKRKDYRIDKSKLRKIIADNGVTTTDKLREVINFYRNKKRIIIIGGGNFMAILALCLTSVAFMFSVNDGYTDMRFALVIFTVLIPLFFYYIYRLIKRRINIYSNFYQILEELLSEILIEDLDKGIKPTRKPRTAKKKEPSAQNTLIIDQAIAEENQNTS